jgi:hypothetical protein
LKHDHEDIASRGVEKDHDPVYTKARRFRSPGWSLAFMDENQFVELGLLTAAAARV